MPPRPPLPPVFWALLAAIAVMRASLLAGAQPFHLVAGAGAVLVLGGLACATALALGRPGALHAALPVLAAIACSLLVCGVELRRQAELSGALGSSAVSAWELRLETDMSEGSSGWRGRAVVLEDGHEVGGVWLVSQTSHRMGVTLRCVGRFSPNEAGEWGASSRAQGLAGTVRVVRVLEKSPADGPRGLVLDLREAVLRRLDPASSDARALLAGTICGSTTAMAERGLSDTFAACGVSHLVAVSGGHLVLVSALAGRLLSRARLGPLPRTVVLLAVTGGFVVFCGAPASALRSWGMSLVAELSRFAGRRSHPLSSASAVALCMALARPGVTGQLGYLLSVVCVCGICVFGGYARHVVRTCLPRPARRGRGPLRRALGRAGDDAREALALTLVSQAVSSPLTCAAFSQLSVIAPLANVVLAPLFSALLALGLAVAALQWAPPVQAVALLGCDVVGGAVMAALRVMAGMPLACVAVSVEEGPALVALAVLAGALLLWWPRVSRAAVIGGVGAVALAAALYVARWRLLAPARVVVLDVGQGDAILVTDGPSAVLVDTGPGDAVVEALARNHVFHLDAVVLTHLHSDHAGGLQDVLGVVDVGALVVPEGTDASPLFDAAQGNASRGDSPEVVEVRYGDTLVAGGFRMRAVSPVEPAGGEGNEGSLELLLSFEGGGRSLTGLLAADAEREETDAAIERGDVGDVDFLKVGHHGSEVSVTPEIAEALDPELSVASAGEGNSYGHPDPVCVGMLEAVGSTFVCTKDVGDVTVEPGRDGPLVTFRSV